MKNSDFWKRKLTSRKFWAALIGVITSLCVVFGVDGLTTEQIVAVVSSSGVLIAYIASETCIDLKENEKSESQKAPDEENK